MAQTDKDGNLQRRAWEARPISYTAKVACGTCNNGWMSRLEARQKATLRALINTERPPGGILTREVQRDLALWAYKTAIVIDVVKDHDHVTSARQRRALMTDHEPSSVCVVVAGSFRENRSFLILRAPAIVGSLTTMTMQSLSLQVFLLRDLPHPEIHEATSGVAQVFANIHRDWMHSVVIWPTTPLAVWPPRRQMDMNEYELWAQAGGLFPVRPGYRFGPPTPADLRERPR